MVTLGSLTGKVGKDLNKPLTYWIGSKCWELYVICKGIDWKSIPHQDIKHYVNCSKCKFSFINIQLSKILQWNLHRNFPY
jgi:hypothetical protein